MDYVQVAYQQSRYLSAKMALVVSNLVVVRNQ